VSKQGRAKLWSLDNKLTLAGVVVSVLALISGAIFAFLDLNGSGNSIDNHTTNGPVNIGTNNGQINVGSTVINGSPAANWGDPQPGGSTAPGQVFSCSAASPAQSSSAPQRRPAQALAVDFFVRPYRNDECFETSVAPSVTPSMVEFEIRYKNTSNIIQNNVVLSVQLAKSLYLIPGTTYLMNGDYPNGHQVDTDAISANGIIVGSYAPGAAAYIAFEVDTPAINDLRCGRNVLRSVDYAQPKGMDYFYNTADIILTRPCPNPSSS